MDWCDRDNIEQNGRTVYRADDIDKILKETDWALFESVARETLKQNRSFGSDTIYKRYEWYETIDTPSHDIALPPYKPTSIERFNPGPKSRYEQVLFDGPNGMEVHNIEAYVPQMYAKTITAKEITVPKDLAHYPYGKCIVNRCKGRCSNNQNFCDYHWTLIAKNKYKVDWH